MAADLLQKKYGKIVQGPTGDRMPEQIARVIESSQKKLPEGITFRRAGKSADVESDGPDSRTEVSIITTSAVDRDDEVVLPGGGDWAEFKRNPVVTFDHNYNEPPVGTCQWIKARGDALIAKTLYPTKPADWGDAAWLPSAIWHLLQQDPPVCTGKSIGFMPTNVRKATSAEIAKRPELKGLPIIDQWIGLEYAVTPMPCNPEAGVISVEKSADVDEHAVELVTKSYGAALDRLKRKATMKDAEKGANDIADVSADALQEASQAVAQNIPYYTLEQYYYALMRRLDLTDEHAEIIQVAIIDTFERAMGVV